MLKRPSLPRAISIMTSPMAITCFFSSAIRSFRPIVPIPFPGPEWRGGGALAMRPGRYAQEYPRKMNGLGVLEDGDMLYYNISMSEHHDHGGHRHHHHPGHVHPP